MSNTQDPTDPGYDVEVLREHVRHLERRIRQLHSPALQTSGFDAHDMATAAADGFRDGVASVQPPGDARPADVERTCPFCNETWVEQAATAQASEPSAAEYKGWYCAHCQRGVDAREVTFSEQHEVCGRYIADDRPPAPARAVEPGGDK